jgi:hypothetical protein
MKRVNLQAARAAAKPTIPVETMETIAADIRTWMGENLDWAKKTGDNTVRIGGAFKRAKAKAKENRVRWLDWLKEQGWNERFAQRCMSVYDASQKNDNFVGNGLAISAAYLLAQAPEEVQNEIIAQAKEAGTILTHATVKSKLDEVSGNKPLPTAKEDWYTPPRIIKLVEDVFGGEIDVDPASCMKAQETVGARTFFTKQQDGLKQDWNGAAYLNAPFQDMEPWIKKLIVELGAGRTTSAIMVSNNYTETKWFHAVLECSEAICCTKGRIKFVDPEGNEAECFRGQFFYYFGPRVDRFEEVFGDIGTVLTIPKRSPKSSTAELQPDSESVN